MKIEQFPFATKKLFKNKKPRILFGNKFLSSSSWTSGVFHPGEKVAYVTPFNTSIKPNAKYLERQWKNINKKQKGRRLKEFTLK